MTCFPWSGNRNQAAQVYGGEARSAAKEVLASAALVARRHVDPCAQVGWSKAKVRKAASHDEDVELKVRIGFPHIRHSCE